MGLFLLILITPVAGLQLEITDSQDPVQPSTKFVYRMRYEMDDYWYFADDMLVNLDPNLEYISVTGNAMGISGGGSSCFF